MKIKNRGVIEGIRDTDWVAGATSQIQYEVLNPTADWRMYQPLGEWQMDLKSKVDSMSCVSFAGANTVETILNFMWYTGKLSEYTMQQCALNGYLTNRATKQTEHSYVALSAAPELYTFNFSDRFLAVASHTTIEGNWLWKVDDAIRLKGMVAEYKYLPPDNYSFDQYHAPLPADLYLEGLKFLDLFEVNYERIEFSKPDELVYHLKQGPLHISIPGHSIMEYEQLMEKFRYLDHYEPFLRERNGLPVSAYKLVIKEKFMNYTLVRAKDDVYRIKDGKKDLYINGTAFQQLDGRWDAIKTVTQSYLDSIPDGAVLIVVPQE